MFFYSDRWRVCILLQVITLFIILPWGYESMCPRSIKRSGAARVASIIPEEEMEKALQEAEVRMRYKKEHETILNTEGIMMEEKLGDQKVTHHKESLSPSKLQDDRKKLLFLEASNIFSQKYKLTPEEVYRGLEVLAQRQDSNGGDEQDITCDPNARYRSIDGSCNHVNKPTWGQANTCFTRLLEPLYRDNDAIWKTRQCGERPGSRHISEALFSNRSCLASDRFNVLHVLFAQFAAHDLVQTVEGESDASCCPSSPRADRSSECIPIRIPKNDSFYKNTSCLRVVRSQPCTDHTGEHRVGKNQATHFLDLSVLYSKTKEEANSLRRNDGSGKLQSQMTMHGELLSNCSELSPEGRCSVCYNSGDSRSNQTLALASIHTLWLREHNRIANELTTINPHWSEEELFQESKKILTGKMQVITYNEYLEPTVGSDIMKAYDLRITRERTMCDNETNPTISEEFGVSVFRYAHYIIPSLVYKDNHGNLHLLRDLFFCSENLQKGDFDVLMRGMVTNAANRFDCCFVADVRDFLRRIGNDPGEDLSAIDIQRGRDRGLRPYVDYVKYCVGIEIETFVDFASSGLMTFESALYLQCVYRVVEAVDLFTALCFERPVKGGIVGPVAACIIAKQFNVTKKGDCFWLQDRNSHNNGSFTDDQLAEIMKSSMASLICLNSKLTEVPQKALELPGPNNPMVKCENLEDIDLEKWREVPASQEK